MADRFNEIAMQLVRDLRDDGPALPNDSEQAALIEATLRKLVADRDWLISRMCQPGCSHESGCQSDSAFERAYAAWSKETTR
jgi:hypothetical protein